MSNKELFCISCKRNINNLADATKFNCPNCNKFEIIRCKSCRTKSIKYVCSSCNFDGPN